MARDVEISTLDLRYESYRMRNSAQEARLFASIADRGIEEPLEGVATQEWNILLDGFKRYRCARKLRIEMVPFTSLGEDEAMGIVGLLRVSNNKTLSILEQARFIDDIKNLHRMNVAEIAEELSRSKSWVSMRLGLIGEMTEAVRQKIFSGAFPIYPYMYTLRRFMRMNSVTKAQIEEFVVAVSGKKLSVREIEQLAHGYFRGPESFREEIRNGNVALRKLETEHYDVIISDLKMPGMGGEELYESVRRISPDMARRIIFSTGDVASDEARSFLERTGNPYLQKPFELATMRKVVAQMTVETH